MDHDPDKPHRRRSIRSFVLRAGRITPAQERALTEGWPRFGIDPPLQDADRSATIAPLDFTARFGRCAALVVEIGFGNGENLLALATTHPDKDFLGIEVHRAGVGHLLLRAEEAALGNLRVMQHDAVEAFEHQIAPGVLDEVLVLFPDPWHKKRHHKRRLVQPDFVALLASRLRVGGRLQLATDWEPYARQMLEVLSTESSLRNCAVTADAADNTDTSSGVATGSVDPGFVPRPTWRALTRFERRGHRLGHGVWDLSFERVAAPTDRPINPAV